MTAAGPQVQIQACVSPEQPGWLDMRHALWPDSTRDELAADLPEMLARPERYVQFVAYADRRPVGFIEASVRSDYVNGTSTSPVAFIEGIYVDPGSRRRGIARALAEAVYQWARGRGLREIGSDALLDNVDSHAMHRALGFEEADRVVYFRRDLW